jgi:hypothetical protein
LTCREEDDAFYRTRRNANDEELGYSAKKKTSRSVRLLSLSLSPPLFFVFGWIVVFSMPRTLFSLSLSLSLY